MLVFFDDTLIYNQTWEEDLQHLEEVLRILEEKQFYAKLSKCKFGLTEMLYLWHIISADGVKVHKEKTWASRDWPVPCDVTTLRGFLGIFTYYIKFFKGFSQLATSLTDLTKKGTFTWTDGAQVAFDCLKEVMSSCPILALPYFSQPFMVECDASRVGGGVVLSQDVHSIAFESRKLLLHELSYSINDKEMLAIMHALAKFHQYLVGNQFQVKTDHNNLQHFMR